MVRGVNKKAQSTLEYILVLTAIVGLLIWAASTPIKNAVQKSLEEANTAIGNAADKLQ
jgi:uncharacterized protein (UPF0333 family)